MSKPAGLVNIIIIIGVSVSRGFICSDMYLESIHASKVEETKTEPFVIVKLALHIVRESHLIIAHYGCFPECAHDEYFMRVFLSQRWAFLPDAKWTS